MDMYSISLVYNKSKGNLWIQPDNFAQQPFTYVLLTGKTRQNSYTDVRIVTYDLFFVKSEKMHFFIFSRHKAQDLSP